MLSLRGVEGLDRGVGCSPELTNCQYNEERGNRGKYLNETAHAELNHPFDLLQLGAAQARAQERPQGAAVLRSALPSPCSSCWAHLCEQEQPETIARLRDKIRFLLESKMKLGQETRTCEAAMSIQTKKNQYG